MFKLLKQTPSALGYRFPAEWEPHAATWLSWPRPEGVSFPDRYEHVPPTLAAFIREIAPRERVEINVHNGNYEQIVRRELEESGCPLDNVFFHYIPTNECWCRDYGPAFVVKEGRGGRKIAIVDFAYNAWGGKYPPFDADDAVPLAVAQELGLPLFQASIVMEGGSVDFNGRGTVLTTESCLLNKNRNPHLTKRGIERYLRSYYGQKKVLWLEKGIAGDDTDGHIDDVARFVNPTTIVIGIEDNPRDRNYRALQDGLELLRGFTDQDGNPFTVVPMPMPKRIEHENQRLPATYMNFYFVNGALLVPTFRQKRKDRKAIEILQDLLPDREVIGIDCTELIWGLGALHCLTQQQAK